MTITTARVLPAPGAKSAVGVIRLPVLTSSPSPFIAAILLSLRDMERPNASQLGVVNWLGRMPALPAAIVFVVGIVCGSFLPHAPLWFIAAAVVASLAAIALAKHQLVSCIAIAAALWLLGVAAIELEGRYPANHVGLFTSNQPQLVWMELKLDDWSRVIQPSPTSFEREPHQVVTADAIRIRTSRGYDPCSGKLILQVHHRPEQLQAGQTVEVFGWLQRPEPPANPGQFDWYRYHREQGVLATLTVRSAQNLQVVRRDPPSILSRLRRKTRQLLDAGFNQNESMDHDLLRALVVGDRNPQMRDIQELFAQTGASHQLALSGMHVAIVAGFVYLICRLLRINPRRTTWTILTLVLLYGAVVLPAPPAVRAVLMSCTVLVGLLLRKRANAIHLLSLCAIVMLVFQPVDLFNPGFQLSFGTVLGLLLFTVRLFEYFISFRDEDKEIARQLQASVGGDASGWWKYAAAWRRRENSALQMVACACVAWVVSLPMVLYHFDRISPWAIAAGLVIAPVVILGIIGGLLKIVLTLALPFGAAIWATLATWPMAVLRKWVALLAMLPGSGRAYPPPSLWVIAIYYGLLLCYLFPLLRRRFFKALPMLGCCICIASPMFKSPSRDLRVTILSVGAGSCAIVQTPTGHNFVIDAGSSTYPDVYRSVIEPFLRHEHITRIDAIYISHANTDHYNGAAGIARTMRPQIVLTPQFALDAKRSSAARQFLTECEKDKCAMKTAPADGRIDIDADTRLEILWPPDDARLTDNESSMVLRLRFAGKTILFTGDIQQSAERALSFEPKTSHADVLVAPHHGSSESTTPDFVKAVSPQIIISSNDSTLTTKQRRFEFMIDHRPLYRTDRSGAIFVTISPDGTLSTTTFRTVAPRAVSTR